MRTATTLIGTAALLSFVLASAPARAASVLGANGQLFSAEATTISVPVGDARERHTALRFSLVAQGGTLAGIVPGTDGAEIESEPFAWQSETGTVFLLWLSHSAIHDVIHLRTFKDGLWSPDVTVCSDEFSAKSHLSAVLSRDTAAAADGVKRQVVHLFWREDGSQGTRLQHMPLLFADSVYLGAGRIRALAELAGNDPGDATVAGDLPLLAQRGRDADEIVALFGDATGARLFSVGVSVTPEEIERLAAALRSRILASEIPPDDDARLADEASSFLLSASTTLNPGVLHGISAQMRAHINPGGRTSRLQAANALSDALLAAAAELMARPRRLPAVIKVVDAELDGVSDPAVQPLHLVVSVIGTWSMPDAPPASLVLSRDASKAIAVWKAPGAPLLYRESRADGTWGQGLRLDAAAGLDASGIAGLLQDRSDDSD